MTAMDAEPRGAAKPPCVGSPRMPRGLHQGRRRRLGAQGSSPCHPGLATQHRGFWTLTGQWTLTTGVGWPEGALSLSRLRVCRVWDVTAPRYPPAPLAAPPCFPTEMTPQPHRPAQWLCGKGALSRFWLSGSLAAGLAVHPWERFGIWGFTL